LVNAGLELVLGRSGEKRKEWVVGLHRGKEKKGGGLGRLGNMAQEGFGKF
jgi:hypothetical protein